MSIVDAARAFSGHDFEASFAALDDDAEWDVPGGEGYRGKAAIVAACRDTAEHLAMVTTTFHRFDVLEADADVVVDSLAEYRDGTGESTWVASCDRYQAGGGRIVRIRSFNVVVTAP